MRRKPATREAEATTAAPAPTWHTYSLRLPMELWERLWEGHWQQRKSINELIVEALEERYR